MHQQTVRVRTLVEEASLPCTPAARAEFGLSLSPDFSPGDAMTNRQDRRFARRQPPVGLRPEPAPLLSQGQALLVVSRGMGAKKTSEGASSAVCNVVILRR